MEVESTMQQSMSQVLNDDPTVQGVALVDGSGYLVAKRNRSDCKPLEKEEVFASIARTAAGMVRGGGVVCIETDQRTLFVRKDHDFSVIVAHDPISEAE
eukprot:gene7232-11133_t